MMATINNTPSGLQPLSILTDQKVILKTHSSDESAPTSPQRVAHKMKILKIDSGIFGKNGEIAEAESRPFSSDNSK
jgi:hypothetical protein